MDIAALKAVSGRLQQRALARLSLKSPPNRIAREDAALDQEAAASILSLIARLEALEEALRQAEQALTHAGVFIGNPAMGEGPREVAFDACVKAVATIAVLSVVQS
jgi:hypothetical protein